MIWVPSLEKKAAELFRKKETEGLPIFPFLSPYGPLYAVVSAPKGRKSSVVITSSEEQAERISHVDNYRVNGLPKASELIV